MNEPKEEVVDLRAMKETDPLFPFKTIIAAAQVSYPGDIKAWVADLRQMSLEHLVEALKFDLPIIEEKDESWRVRFLACDELSHRADPSTEDALLQCADGYRSEICQAAAHGLGRIGTDRCLVALSSMIVNNDPDIRLAGARALEIIENPRVCEAFLAGGLASLDGEALSIALQTLISRGSPFAELLILRVIGDRYEQGEESDISGLFPNDAVIFKTSGRKIDKMEPEIHLFLGSICKSFAKKAPPCS